eukprot:4274935-Alexandrium_andersonii.AAC.1
MRALARRLARTVAHLCVTVCARVHALMCASAMRTREGRVRRSCKCCRRRAREDITPRTHALSLRATGALARMRRARAGANT